MEETDDTVTPVAADLYFLIYKFLSGGPFRNTLETFHNELEQCKILPKRTDWNGERHERTIEDLEHEFVQIRPDYLLQLCCRASNSNQNIRDGKVETLISLKKTSINVNYNFQQLLNYIRRNHLIPVNDFSVSHNIVNIVRGCEISGPVSRKRNVSPRLYSALQFQRRTLGHLSAVYCLLFDHSGRYILTGADDLLIKLWSSRTGRLINTFRGASMEIADIAINLENTLLAAGSIDRILRIWDLQSGAPVAVLTGHTGIITSVNFCPSPSWNFQYLITTSGDGSVAFWAYTHDTDGKFDFRAKPTMYQEKMRPGQAQMICSSFSPGGVFLATGSGDHHVRVYYMKGDEGPHRILEIEAHSDRVDSIQWANSGLKFLSGSKDGTAIVWSFECQQWKTLRLDMSLKQANCTTAKKTAEEAKKLRVTMVAWATNDQYAVTAVSDRTLKIWSSTSGQLYKVLSGHTDEIYVLEAHPLDNHVILSAAHDGHIFVWDIVKGEVISRFFNNIENQGHGAIFDVKWSPDGSVIAASDSHGHLLIFGFGNGCAMFEQLPKELFFHTDYRPLVRDANNYVLDEQTQVPPHLMPPPFLVDVDGNPYPPMLQRLVPGREHCKTEQLVPSVILGTEGTQEVIQEVMQDLDDAGRPGHSQDDGDLRGRAGGRRIRDTEGIRQSTGDWQNDPTVKWHKHVLVQPLKFTDIKRVREHVDAMEKFEMHEYHRQLSQRPHMITTSTINESSKTNDRRRSQGNFRSRLKQRTAPVIVLSEPESDLTIESSGHSDWEAEENVDVDKTTKRTRRRQISYDSESDGASDGSHSESRDGSEEPSSSVAPPQTKVKENHRMNHVNKEAVPELYKTSEWLTETRPRKTPYFPQMGDDVVYFPQGHHLYLDVVRTKKIYEINSKILPWTKVPLRSHEYAKVIDIQYEIKPPRLCNLKLALLDDDGRLTGKIVYVKYHDMPDVLDFFVLKQNFEAAMSRDWQIAEKFRCVIDDGWWTGEIVSKSNASEDFPHSPFLCYEIKWGNGELERMSPWDMEPIDDSRLPENAGEALPVLEEELNGILYQPNEGDWPNNNRDSVIEYIVAGLAKVMELAIAEPFLVPVDLNTYPSYAMIVEYPIDLSTIKARFENRFYRRMIAAQFDIRHLAINAEKFNERHSIIVKHARILTELCLRIVKHCTAPLNVNTVYHQLADTYDSSDTEVDVEVMPSSSRMLRSLPSRYLNHAGDWKTEGQNLLDAIWDCEDSVPFRAPVNSVKYPDYHSIIKEPMDLGTVKDKLLGEQYETPMEFKNDMNLIFENSRTYNVDHRSRIFVMTVRLAATFQEHITKLIRNWKMAKRRSTAQASSRRKKRRQSASSSNTTSSMSDLSEADQTKTDLKKSSSDDDEIDVELAEESDSDDSDDDMPLKRLQITKLQQQQQQQQQQQKQQSKNDSEETEDSSSSSDTKKLKVDNKSDDDDDDSEESYKPHNSRKRRQKSSSSDKTSSDSEADDDSDDKPLSTQITRYRSRGRLTKKLKISVPATNNNNNNNNNNNKNINRRRTRRAVSDSDDDDNADGSGSRPSRRVHSSFFNTVSSRGRIRKLNPRVKALIKN